MMFPDPRKPWLLLVSFILGPFAPWIAWLGKLRRRGLAAPGWWLVLTAAMLAVYSALVFMPLRWEFIVTAYFVLCVLSWGGFIRSGAWTFFHFPSIADRNRRGVWFECLAVGALTVYPALFAYGFLHNLSGLMEFSIHLPASVFTESLGFSLLYGTPAAIVLAYAVGLAGWKPGLRLVLQLYMGAFVSLIWFILWAQIQQYGLAWMGAPTSAPLLFDFFTEAHFRSSVQGVFYVAGALFALSYLAGAGSTPAFARRAVFLGLPILLGTMNMNVVLGESGYALAGIRERLYRAGFYPAYRVLAGVEAARLPRAYFMPFLMRDLAELEYLRGNRKAADAWHQRMVKTAETKTYYAPLLNQAEWNTPSAASCSASTEWLAIPRIRAAASLDADWYALLGAVSFFYPKWSDFDLKQKLLELSPFVQLEVPRLEGVPDVVEALDIFGLPFTTCYLDSLRLHLALRNRKIPLMGFEGRWILLVGWDECRRGYMFFRHPDSLERNPWFQTAENGALFGKEGGTPTEEIPFNQLGFLPERLVLKNLHDLGGVGMILGDSSFASPAEKRAAYLVEFGDILYQQHGDYKQAGAAFAESYALFPSDYALARIAYLERLRKWSRGPDRSVEAIFHGWDSIPGFSLNDSVRTRITRRILQGEIGKYLLENWHQCDPRFFVGSDSLHRDSVRTLFHTWLRMDPNNPRALDSLAAGFEAESRWDSAETYYRRSLGFYPLGNEYGAYKLAWCLFRGEKFDELPKWLERSGSYQGEARHTLMAGAVDWQRGHRRSGLKLLKKSLKLDKTLPETYAWLERADQNRSDTSGVKLYRRWRERTEP